MTKRIRIPFTEEEKQEIFRMYKNGIGVTEICRSVPSLNARKPQTLYPLLIKQGLYKKKPADDIRRYSVNDDYFKNIDDEHKAYWVGFMIADGFLVNSGHSKESFGLNLKTDDIEAVQAFKKDLEATYPIHTYTDVSTFDGTEYVCSMSKIVMKSKKIFHDLMSLGFTLKKSYEAKLPLNKIPDHLVKHLVRGYFDGDGSLSKSGDKKWHTYDLKFTGTKEVMEQIRHILSKDNVKLSDRYPERDNNNRSLNLCGDEQVYRICKWMYDGATIFLKRKHDRYLQLKRKYTKNSRPGSDAGDYE